MGNRENRTGVFELGQNPELADLFRVALRGLTLALRTHTVGTVVAYNPATQRATVRVDILQVIKNLNAVPTAVNPNPTSTQIPVVLTNIPVAWPRSGGGYLTFPLATGDTGELHVQDRTLQQWTALGQATDPVGAFTHSLADSIFHPNVHPDTKPITPPTDLTAAVLHHDLRIKLGRAAALGVARLTDTTSPGPSMALWEAQVTAALVAMAAFFNAAPGPVLSAGPGTVPVFPTNTPTDLGVISSASVKTLTE
jgi:hypothetical protein